MLYRMAANSTNRLGVWIETLEEMAEVHLIDKFEFYTISLINESQYQIAGAGEVLNDAHKVLVVVIPGLNVRRLLILGNLQSKVSQLRGASYILNIVIPYSLDPKKPMEKKCLQDQKTG